MSEDPTVRRASARMAAYFCTMLTRGCFEPGITVQAGERIRGWAISTSEHAESLLLMQLDLTAPNDAGRVVLTKSTDAFYQHFASGRYDGSFGKILESYLDFLHWKGDVPTKRGWFIPPEGHLQILKPLADLGYLETDEQGMRWSDLVAPMMFNIGAWNAEARSFEELDEWRVENDARRIARDLRGDLVLLALQNPDSAFLPIFKSLRGSIWTQMPDKRVVERVIEIVRSKSTL